MRTNGEPGWVWRVRRIQVRTPSGEGRQSARCGGTVNRISLTGGRRLRHPDLTGREGAGRGKRLSPELEAGSPVAAVYDRRRSVEDSQWGSATPPYRNGGHRPPLQNTVWAQRDSTGAGCRGAPRETRMSGKRPGNSGILRMDMDATGPAGGARRRAVGRSRHVWGRLLSDWNTGVRNYTGNIAQKSLVPPTADCMFPHPCAVRAVRPAGRWTAKGRKKHRVPSPHGL